MANSKANLVRQSIDPACEFYSELSEILLVYKGLSDASGESVFSVEQLGRDLSRLASVVVHLDAWVTTIASTLDASNIVRLVKVMICKLYESMQAAVSQSAKNSAPSCLEYPGLSTLVNVRILVVKAAEEVISARDSYESAHLMELVQYGIDELADVDCLALFTSLESLCE